jgi:hypothetical protein
VALYQGAKMTTFTTEDRIIAEMDGSVTINVEPIPFAGLVTITDINVKKGVEEMNPQLQDVLRTIFTRVKALEDAIEQLKKEMNK